MSEPKDKKKCAVAICCAALLTAESVVPAFATSETTEQKKIPTPEKAGIVKGLPAPLAEFRVADKGGETNISDLSLSVTDFKGIDAAKSRMYLKDKDKELESVEIDGNKIYRFKTKSLPEDNYVVGYEITDSEGNVVKDEKEFIVDNTKPAIEINHTATKPINTKAVDVSLKFTDKNLDKNKIKITVLKDGKPYEKTFAESENVVKTASFDEDGKYEIKAEAEDKRGNKADAKEISFEVDMNGPKVEAKNLLKDVELSKDGYVKSFNDVIFHVSDNNFEKLSVVLEKEGKKVYSKEYDKLPEKGEITLEGFNGEDGTYALKIHGSDTAGNVSDVNFEIVKDMAVPVITFEGVKDSQLTNKDVTLKAILKDSNLDNKTVKLEVMKDEKPVKVDETYTDSISKTFAEAGKYVVTISGKDKSMNEAKESISFEIDKTSPVVKANNTYKNEDLSKEKNIRAFSDIEAFVTEDNLKKINVEIRDKRGAVYEDELTPMPEGGKVKIKNFDKKDGKYTFYIKVEDKAGNITEKTFNVVKDTEGPVITFEGVKEFFNKDFTLKTLIEDEDFSMKGVTYKVKRNGLPVKTNETYANNTIEETFTEEGKYTVEVEARDFTFNKSEKSVSFEIDKTLPEIKAENLLKDKSLTGDNHIRKFSEIKVTAKDKNLKEISVKIQKDGKDVYEDKAENLSEDSVVNVKDFSGKDGKYVLIVKAEDKAGNIKEETFDIIKDTETPKISFEGAKAFNNKEFTLKAILTDDNLDTSSVTYEVFKNGKKVSSKEKLEGNIISEVFSDEGEYSVKVKVKDNSLNEGMAEISFEVDKKTPEVDVKNILKDKKLEEDNHIKKFSELEIFVKDKNAKAVKVEILKGKDVVYTDAVKDLSSENKITIKDFKGIDGSYTLSILAEDKAENITKKEIPFIKDTDAPKITFEGMKDFNNKDFTLKTILKDDNIDIDSIKFEVKKDGKVIKDENIKKDIIEEPFSEEGEYEVKVSAKDLSLNEASNSVSFEVDKTMPEITVNNLLKKDSLLKDKYVKEFEEIEPVIKEKNLESIIVRIKDEKGMVVYNKELKKMPEGGKVEVENADVKDGKYTLTVIAKDKAENTKTENIEFIKDTKTPDITFEGLKNILEKTFSKIDINLTSKIKDENLDVSSVKYEVFRDGKPVKSESLNKDTVSETFALEGDYEVKLSGKDFSLNEKGSSVFFEIDKTLPTTTISGIPEHGYLHKLGEISVKSTDKNFEKQTVKILRDNKVVLSKDSIKSESISFSESLSDGRYEIVVEAEDKAGNVKVTKDKFIIDTTAPLISFDGLAEGKYYNKNVTLGINVKEENYKDNSVSVKITKTLRGRTVNIPFTFNSNGVNAKNGKTFTEDGTYTVIVNSTDKVGNIAREQKITFTVDKTSPKVDIKNLVGTYGPKSDINSTISIEDDYKDKTSVTVRNDNTGKIVTASLNRGEYVDVYSIKGIKKILSNDGKYTITISAVDKAGNRIAETKGFVVNRFGSTFSFVQKPRAIQKKLKDDVKIRENNLSPIESFDVRITKDGKKLKNVSGVTRNGNIYTISKDNFKDSGVYKIDIISTDAAGNTSEMIKSKGCDYKFTIDKDAPSVYLVGAKNNTVYKENSLKVYIEADDAITGIKDIKAEVNGNDVKVLKEEETGKYYIELKEGFNQNIKVTITDNAGNKSTAKLDKVSVSTGLRATIMQNKLVSALIAIAVGVSGLLVLIFKKKKDEDEEK